MGTEVIDYGKAGQSKAPINRKPYFEKGIECTALITKFVQNKGFKGNSVVFEFKVQDAKATEPGVTAPVPGAERAYVIKGFTGADNDRAPEKVAAVGIALNGKELPGLSEEQKKKMLADGASMEGIVEADKAAKGDALRATLAESVGSMVRINTYDVEIKTGPNAGKPYTVTQFSNVPGQQLADVRARRAQIEAGKL